jgi:DNA-binding GntR family transcriptional regulator
VLLKIVIAILREEGLVQTVTGRGSYVTSR